MARVAISISCTDKDRRGLERLTKSRTDEMRIIERARIILKCLEGKRNGQVAAELGIGPGTVAIRRKRFAACGMKGLQDKQRPGKPPLHPVAELRNRLLAQLGQPPPAGQSTWDGGSLAQALSVSDDTVWRLLRKEGIQLQRHRSWCISIDPEFTTKSADIIVLHLNPPQNALVIPIDEKPSIQATERPGDHVYTSGGKIVRGLKSTYKRHGTLNLFAALNVATGMIQSKMTVTKKRPDLQGFLNEVVADTPDDKEVYIILDNYCTHKKNDGWLAAHPNVKFHFTPTSASWLNQVQIWFGILSRKALRGASFCSTGQPTKAIADFIAAYNNRANPFVWRKRQVKGAQLRNTIVNLCN